MRIDVDISRMASGNYKAHARDRPCYVYGTGRTENQAIGDLLQTYQSTLGIEVECHYPPAVQIEPLDGMAAVNASECDRHAREWQSAERNCPTEVP